MVGERGKRIWDLDVDLYIYECAQNTALMSKLLDRFSLDYTYLTTLQLIISKCADTSARTKYKRIPQKAVAIPK